MLSHIAVSKKQKIINYVLFVLFLLFAIVQLNDPDPALWCMIYGTVSALFLLANFKKIPRLLLYTLMVTFLAFALYHFSYFMDWIEIDHKEELFGEMVYEKPYLEGTREFLGLIICAAGLYYIIKSQHKTAQK